MAKGFRFISILVIFSVMFSLFSCSDPDDKNTSIVLSDKNLELWEIGETYKITATVHSDANPLPTVTWTSSDENVATCVDGLVTVVGYGVCVIRASCDNFSAACTVNIPNPNPKLTLSETTLTFHSLDTARVLTAYSESGADISPKVIWKSSNEKIATCSNGAIKPVSYGICTITAFLNNESRSCIIEVINPDLQKISINLPEDDADDEEKQTCKKLKLNVGDEIQLTATASPKDDSVRWISSDTKVASCVNGKIVAKKSGVCAIIAMSGSDATDYVLLTVGSFANKDPNEAELLFGFPDVGAELKYVDRSTGQISSVSIVTSYSLITEPYENFPDRMLVTLELYCTKVYDIAGEGGVTPAHVTTSMYRENDIFCEQRTFKEVSCSVGDSFTVKYEPQFTIQYSDEGPRIFYMKFAEYTEL